MLKSSPDGTAILARQSQNPAFRMRTSLARRRAYTVNPVRHSDGSLGPIHSPGHEGDNAVIYLEGTFDNLHGPGLVASFSGGNDVGWAPCGRFLHVLGSTTATQPAATWAHPSGTSRTDQGWPYGRRRPALAAFSSAFGDPWHPCASSDLAAFCGVSQPGVLLMMQWGSRATMQAMSRWQGHGAQKSGMPSPLWSPAGGQCGQAGRL